MNDTIVFIISDLSSFLVYSSPSVPVPSLVVPVSSGSQGIQTWFDGAVDLDAFKASIVSAIRNLSSTNGLDVGTSLDSSNIVILGMTPGLHLFIGSFVFQYIAFCFAAFFYNTGDESKGIY